MVANAALNSTSEGSAMFIRTPVFWPSSSIVQSSSFPCDPANLITVSLFFNLPIFSACTPSLVISNLTGSTTTSGIILQATSPANFSNVSVVTWVQATGQLSFQISSLAAVPSDGSMTSLGFSFTLSNRAFAQANPAIAVSIGYLGGLTFSWVLPTLSVLQNNPMLIVQPTLLNVLSAQSSPYPCDINTIAFEMQTNAPTFFQCKPTITISGLTGTVLDLGLNSDGYLTLSSGSTSNIVSPAVFNRGSGIAILNTSADIPGPGWISFNITVRNQAQYQSAPIVSVALNYMTTGGTLPAAADRRPWNASSSWVPSGKLAGLRYPSVFAWSGDVIDWRIPLYIRAPTVMVKNIGQNNPTASSSNVLTITLSLNIELIPLCQPKIIITNLAGACINSSDVALGSANGMDHLSFSSSKYLTGGGGTWTAANSSLILNAFINSNSTTVNYSSTILANQNYVFYFSVTNPPQGQDAPSISAQIVIKGANVTAYAFMQDISTNLPAIGLISPKLGDAMALQVYSPAFIVRSIRQTNPLPGQTNQFIVTIAANLNLPENTVITISGFAIDSTMYPNAFMTKELSPSGSLTLSDIPYAISLRAIVKDAAGVSNGIAGNGYYDRVLGRILMYVGPTGLSAGVNYSFSFQLTNPQCQMNPVSPCIRASRVASTVGCPYGSITRSLMSVDMNTTAGMALINVNGSTGQLPLIGEAAPLQIRQPSIDAAFIQQSTAYPCDTNTLTVRFRTNVPLLAALGQSLIISGLQGRKNGVGIPMPGTSSTVNIVSTSAVLASTASWNATSGVLTASIAADSIGGLNYDFSFVLTNPAVPQDCAASMMLNITGMCFVGVPVVWPIPGYSNDLPGFGNCSSAVAAQGVTDPTTLWGAAGVLLGGRCPLFVTKASVQLNYAQQSSYFPCDPSNTISVYLMLSVPFAYCNTSLVISGLNGTQTASSSQFSVQLAYSNVSTSVMGNWSSTGNLTLSSASLFGALPKTSCVPLVITFVLRNQRSVRSTAASVVVDVKGFPQSGVEGLRSSKFGDLFSLPTPYKFSDPLIVLSPLFTWKMMSQSNPWPGAANTITTTIATNFPLWSDCSSIIISNMQEACAPQGTLSISGTDAGAFSSMVGNTSVNSTGSWSTIIDSSGWLLRQGRLTINITGISSAGTLPCGSVSCNPGNRNYSFQFTVNNPSQAQNSPQILIQGDGSVGIPMAPVSVDKDLYFVPSITTGACATRANLCTLLPGDAAPLRVIAPSFLVADIGQSTPYPSKVNIVSVTLLPNILLQKGSSITLSNLAGTQNPTGTVSVIDGANLIGSPSAYFSASTTSNQVGQGAWDQQAKTLTLITASPVLAGTQVIFSFQVQNGNCGQESPPVCVRAGYIGSTACNNCSQGQCIGLPRQLMNRDMATLYSTGAVQNSLYPFTKYSASALITYGDAALGDAYPLKIYSPSFVVKRIGQSTYFPAKLNTLTVTLATNIPLVAGTMVTITNLSGSTTPDTSSLPVTEQKLSGFASYFSTTAQWSQNGTLVLNVVNDTIAGTQYIFSFNLQNPRCAQAPPSVSISSQPICFNSQPMCADMSTPLGTGFYNSLPGDAQALLVKAPSFRLYNAWQKNPYPGAANQIHVELATNINLPSGTKFTVTGLTGSTTNDSAQLSITFPDQDADSNALASDTTSVLPASGQWFRGNGTLIIPFQAETKANTTYRISIPLTNPVCCQPGRNITLSTDLPCFAPVMANWKSSSALDSSVILFGEIGETQPLLVRCPLWKLVTVAPSSLNVCTNSVLSLTLQINVPVQVSDGIFLTVTGLTGSLTSSSLLAVAGGVLGQASWNQSSGLFIAPWNARATAAYEKFLANFTLVNPSNFTLGTLRTLSSIINMCSANSSLPLPTGSAQYSTSKSLSAPVVQLQAVLSPIAPQFTTYRAGQKTSWPGGLNLITVSLQTNMPLYGADFNCPITLTLSGLAGLCNLGPDGNQIQLTGADASQFNNTATLMLSQKSLILNPNGSLATTRVISFSIRNVGDPQPSPVLQLSGSGVVFQSPSVVIARDISPPAVTGVFGSNFGALFNPLQRDVEPLRILSPAFTVKTIQQSTAWPGASNVITIAFGANLDIQVGSVLVVSSLDYLDGSSGAPTGPLNLIGASALNFSSSFLSSSVQGQGMWDDIAKTLTMFVSSNMTAGSLYTFSFQLKNPLCGQPPSPVCIRARGISIGCSSALSIPRTVLDAAAGDNAPLSIRSPQILTANMMHSTPFASALNQIFLAVQVNVPVNQSWFAPTITITGLTGVQTPSTNSLSVVTGSPPVTLSGSWSRETGTLTFISIDSQANVANVYNFTLQNRPCRQAAPATSVQISSVCNLQRAIDPISVSTCNSQAVRPLEVLGGPCNGQLGSSAMFTQKDIGQSTPYPGCSNTIYVNFMSNVPLTTASNSTVSIDFANSLSIGVQTSFGDVSLGGASANQFYGSSSVVGASIYNSGINCTCPGSIGTLIFTAAAGDSGTGAAGTYTVTNGMISNVSIISGGSGYLRPPVVSLLNSVCTTPPNLTSVMSYGVSAAGRGQWNAANNMLTLGVLSDLSACTPYSLSFVVQNPTTMLSLSAATPGSLLQDSMPVYISAGGTVINSIEMNYTSAYLNALPSVSSLNGDHRPLRVYLPRLLIKRIGQSNPFPGAQTNILTITFSFNTMLRMGTKIAINGITGSMGTVLSRGNLPLWLGSDATTRISDQNFASELSNTVNSGTWYDCEKTLTLLVNQDLDCLGTAYAFSFKVANPVVAQPCSAVRINVTGIPVPAVYGSGVYTQITDASPGPTLGRTGSNGVLFDPDLDTLLSVQGASKGDACPMKIWPAAFVVKDIGQTSPYPCAVNTIMVTISSNVPLPSRIQYANAVEIINPYIIISRISNALVGDVGAAPTTPSNSTAGPDVVSVSNSVTKIIALVASDTFLPGVGWIADNGLFRSGAADGFGVSQALWSSTNLNESSVQIYISNATNSQLYFRNGMGAQSGCFDQMTRFRLGFRVYNPQIPQTPGYAVSIQAFGIPIPPSSMQLARGQSSPMVVTQGGISGYIEQTSASPCSLNTISITLSANIPLLPRCSPTITFSGLSTSLWNSNFTVQELLTSFLGPVDNSLPGRLVIVVQPQQTIPVNQIVKLGFSVTNPSVPADSTTLPSPQVMASPYLLPANLSRNILDKTRWPGMVQKPTFTKAEIWQTSPFPSTKNLITITIRTDTDISSNCKTVITITNLAGACLTNGKIVLSSIQTNPGPSLFSNVPGGVGGFGAWDQGSSSLMLYAVSNLSSNTDYSFQILVTNPPNPQISPAVSIQASGVSIQPFAMTRISGVPSVMSLFAAIPVESQPLEIRGVSRPWLINGTVSQSSATPGSSNAITLSVVANIPLTANPQTVMIVSGFSGGQASDGNIVINDANGRTNSLFSGIWNNSAKRLFLSVISAGDTAAGQFYVLVFNLTNPVASQPSPTIFIETTGGVTIQKAALISAPDISAPLYISTPAFYGLGIQRQDFSAYPGATSATILQFASNVDLVPQASNRLSIVLNGLVGASLPAGVVNITSVPSNIFTACDVLVAANCTPNTAAWDSIGFALKLNVLATVGRNTQISVTLQHNNSLTPQSAPIITIELTRNFAGFTIPPVPFAAIPSIDADQQALLIYGSATFTVSTVAQSSSLPGATNTITVSLKPSVPIVGDQGVAITISGMLGAVTPDGQLKVYDTGSIYFASIGSWRREGGTIILRVMKGQIIPVSSTTVFKFDVTNPSYAQQGSDQILLSASGGIPIAPVTMSGSILPLKVDALSFTLQSIAQSTAVPDQQNTITVTFQSTIVLSKSRRSQITIEGLIGSGTQDTSALPINIANPSLAIFSPFDDVNVSLGDSCRWSDNQVQINGQLAGSDITGTVLVFTSGDCQGRWTTVTSFNPATRCCNLATTAATAGGLWDDGSPRCSSLGKVDSFKVISGGSGYRPGDGTSNSTMFTVDPQVSGGNGLVGTCVVNSVGSVVSVVVAQAGLQYSENVTILCPSNCASGSCPVALSGSGAILQARTKLNQASILAGSWRKGQGSIVLRVRDQVFFSILM